MSIIGTFNGANIIALPSDVDSACMAPASLEFDAQEVVGVTTSPFTGSQQLFDWQQSWPIWHVGFAALDRHSADKWESFLMQCRGPLNVFSIGDPKRATPKGNPVGTPVVNGAGQSGYTLATRGWTASATGVLLDGDCIQIGYRLHRVTADANADSSGHATLAIWPPLRETPADGATIQTSNCKGIFRLVASTGNKSSTTTSSLFGLSGFQIREAL